MLTSEWSDLSTNASGDNKFCVSEEGLYLVSFNTSTLKIKAEKLNEPSKDGNYYLISSVNDYYWFAAYIATDATNASKARLTQNLSFEGKTFTPLASDKHKFKGEFDGDGHTIDYAIVNSDYSNIGLFCYADVAYIHDLVIGANSSFKGVSKVGGIIGFARDKSGDVTLENVINEARIEATGSTDANAAGLVGCATDGTKIFATNCANTGEVRGQDGQCAAFTGWAQSGTIFTNCWNIGDIYNMQDNKNLYRGDGVSISNCYDANGAEFYTQGTKITRSAVASGELCYKLNGDQTTINYYQTIGTDNYPVPFSSSLQVYPTGDVRCDGGLLGNNTFTNDVAASTPIPDHTYANGWCSECGSLDKNYLAADGEGFFNIGTANDLKWFAEIVAAVNQSAKAKLTEDIDYTDYKQGFIGTSEGTPFRGIFDGQEHSIKIDIVNAGTGRTGLFAYINAATIRNLVVEGSATSAGNNCVGGLGGRSDNDGTFIENVIVKTAVSYTGTSGDATCGGFFANMEGQVTLKNCAFLGSINSGTAEGNGGLVGWAGGGDGNKYINCLVAPTEYTKNGNSGEFSRNNPTVQNSYYVASDDARLASGELCYKLNADGDNWFQCIGTDAYPLPFNTHSKVLFVGDTGYATLFDTTSGYELSGDVKAYVAVLNNTWLDLTEVEGVPASTPVVLKGTYYNKVAANLPAISVPNDLKGAATDIEADGTMYVLAKVEDKVGFFKAEGTIAAGKAYYQSTSGVKAFYFEGGDATGISDVNVNLNEDNAIYNIAGQRLQKMQKGINIVNGKKVLF